MRMGRLQRFVQSVCFLIVSQLFVVNHHLLQYRTYVSHYRWYSCKILSSQQILNSAILLIKIKFLLQVSENTILEIGSLSTSDSGRYRCEARQCGVEFRTEEVDVVVEEGVTPSPTLGPENLEIQKRVGNCVVC